MKFTECRICKHKISIEAIMCPNCGAPHKVAKPKNYLAKRIAIIIAVIAVAILAWIGISANNPEMRSEHVQRDKGRPTAMKIDERAQVTELLLEKRRKLKAGNLLTPMVHKKEGDGSSTANQEKSQKTSAVGQVKSQRPSSSVQSQTKQPAKAQAPPFSTTKGTPKKQKARKANTVKSMPEKQSASKPLSSFEQAVKKAVEANNDNTLVFYAMREAEALHGIPVDANASFSWITENGITMSHRTWCIKRVQQYKSRFGSGKDEQKAVGENANTIAEESKQVGLPNTIVGKDGAEMALIL